MLSQRCRGRASDEDEVDGLIRPSSREPPAEPDTDSLGMEEEKIVGGGMGEALQLLRERFDITGAERGSALERELPPETAIHSRAQSPDGRV